MTVAQGGDAAIVKQRESAASVSTVPSPSLPFRQYQNTNPSQDEQFFRRWGVYNFPLGWLRRASRGPLFLLNTLWRWVDIRVPLLCLLIYVYVHWLLFSLTLRVVSIFLFPLLWDWASYWYFWLRSIHQARANLLAACRADPKATADFLSGSQLWHHRSKPIDKLITAVHRVERFFELRRPRAEKTQFDLSEESLRQALFWKPPAFPLSSHDYFWLQDTPENTCQIIALALVDRMTITQLQNVIASRWVEWDSKFSSILSRKFGRTCWLPLLRHPLDPEIEPNPLKVTKGEPLFRLSDHVYEVSIDLCQTTVYESLSILASEVLPRTKPRWRCVLLNPIAQDEIKSNFSCLALQVHHGLGDGIAIAAAVVHRLFDQPGQPLAENLKPIRALTSAPDCTLDAIVPPRPPSVMTECAEVRRPLGSARRLLRQHAEVSRCKGIKRAQSGPTFGSARCPQTLPKPTSATRPLWSSMGTSKPGTAFNVKHSPTKSKIKGNALLNIHLIQTAIYYAWNVLKCAIYGIRVLCFWLLWCPKPPAFFQPSSVYTLDRSPPSGTKFLAPPVVIEMQQMSHLRDSVKHLADFAPTINDIMAYCLTVVAGRLRSGVVVKELRLKMQARKRQQTSTNAPSILKKGEEAKSKPLVGYSTPSLKPRQPSRRFPFQHICEGVPKDPIEVDLSTPTALRSHPVSFFPPSGGILRGLGSEVCDDSNMDTHTSEIRGQQLWQQCVSEWVNIPERFYHPYASNFESYLQLLIPMTTRTSMPTGMDNFTGPVLVRLPLISFTETKFVKGIHRWAGILQPVLGDVTKDILLALKHLKAVKAEIDEMKRTDLGPVFFLLICLACKVLPDFLSKRIVTETNDRMQVLLTNVIGPTDERKIAGCSVRSLQFWPPAKGEVTGGIAILSFRNKLQIFSIFDEAEFKSIFGPDDYASLTKHDRAALSQFVANLVKAEFLSLYDTVVHGGLERLKLPVPSCLGEKNTDMDKQN